MDFDQGFAEVGELEGEPVLEKAPRRASASLNARLSLLPISQIVGLMGTGIRVDEWLRSRRSARAR